MAANAKQCLAALRNLWKAGLGNTVFVLTKQTPRHFCFSTRRTAEQLVSRKPMNGIKAEASAEWIPIYRFKLITVIAAISKIKILQTALTVVLVPVAWKQYMDAAQSPTLVLIISFAAVVALVMLYVVTALTRRTIGVISKHWLQSVVRIGYLDFWGFRRNIIVPIEDLVPLTDISYDKRGAYLKLERYSDDSFKLYLSLRKYEIVDEKLFRDVFGSLLH